MTVPFSVTGKFIVLKLIKENVFKVNDFAIVIDSFILRIFNVLY